MAGSACSPGSVKTVCKRHVEAAAVAFPVDPLAHADRARTGRKLQPPASADQAAAQRRVGEGPFDPQAGAERIGMFHHDAADAGEAGARLAIDGRAEAARIDQQVAHRCLDAVEHPRRMAAQDKARRAGIDLPLRARLAQRQRLRRRRVGHAAIDAQAIACAALGRDIGEEAHLQPLDRRIGVRAWRMPARQHPEARRYRDALRVDHRQALHTAQVQRAWQRHAADRQFIDARRRGGVAQFQRDLGGRRRRPGRVRRDCEGEQRAQAGAQGVHQFHSNPSANMGGGGGPACSPANQVSKSRLA